MNKIVAIICSILLCNVLFAQKVGVVLSGGGAKGLYHIGVLKALEENDIPVDYVAGTSMGSIVAGLYAAGYTVEEMEELFRSGEVEYWLSGKIPDKYNYYYKKMAPRPYLFSFDINIKRDSVERSSSSKNRQRNKIKIDNPMSPSSLIPSTQLDVMMMKYTSPVSKLANQSFDSLFVPFRCVSVDIQNHTEYVWDKGDLGLAIRSSMSIPIVFKPVRIDSMIMYDGGLMNNFPWQYLERDFAPDFFIGAKCTSNADPNTISGQIEMLIMNKTDYNLPKNKSVMIERDVDVGMLDFKKVEYTMSMGYNDALRMIEQIKARVDRRVTKAEVDKRRLEFRKNLPTVVFDKVTINGLNSNQRSYVTSQINPDRFSEREIGFEDFKKEYYNIISENIVDPEYPMVTYKDSTGAYTVALDMVSKPGLKMLVGIDISSSAINQGYVGLQYRDVDKISRVYTFDGYFGTFYDGVQFGMRSNHYRRRPFYTEYALAYNFYDFARGNSQRFSYKYENINHLRYNDVYASALIGYGLGRNGKAEIRAATGYDTYSYFHYIDPYNVSTPDKSKLFYFTINGKLVENTLNYTIYPTRGKYRSLSAYGVYMNEKYEPGSTSEEMGDVVANTTRSWLGVKGVFDQYHYICKHFSLGYGAELLYSNQPPLYNELINNLVAPGFYPNPISRTLYMPSFRSHSYVAIGVKPIFELNSKFYLKTEFYGFMSEIDNWNNIKDRLKYVTSATVVYQFPFGPVSFNYSHFNDDYIRRDYFVLNVGFTLFNRNGIVY